MPNPNPRVVNQHAKCSNGTDAYPFLWLDVVLLIDNSADQTLVNFRDVRMLLLIVLFISIFLN